MVGGGVRGDWNTSMNRTQLFDKIMDMYGSLASDVLLLAGPDEKLVEASIRSHAAGFVRGLAEILKPDPEESEFKDQL